MHEVCGSVELCSPPLLPCLLPCTTQGRALPELEGPPRKTVDCHSADEWSKGWWGHPAIPLWLMYNRIRFGAWVTGSQVDYCPECPPAKITTGVPHWKPLAPLSIRHGYPGEETSETLCDALCSRPVPEGMTHQSCSISEFLPRG